MAEQVDKQIEEALKLSIGGSTTTRDRLTVIWVGKHLFAVHKKGSLYWASRGEPSKYAPAEIELHEIKPVITQRFGCYKTLHPKNYHDHSRLTKTIKLRCIEEAKKEDELYPSVIAKREAEEANEEKKQKEAEALVAEAASKISLRGRLKEKASLCTFDSKSYASYSMQGIVTLQPTFASLFGVEKGELSIGFSTVIGSGKLDMVTFHLEANHGSVGGKIKAELLPQWIEKVVQNT